MKLKKKIVLVTGASKGIGAATVLAFAKEGCSVIINYKDDGRSARELVNRCCTYSSGNIVLKADITKNDEVVAMMKRIKKVYRSLDILVNNVGIFDEKDSPTNIKAFENIYKTNFLSHVHITKEVLRLMKRGKIINVSSIHGRLGYGRPTAIAYAAMKAALESYTKTLAKSLAPRILVNAIAPGRVATPMWGSPNTRQQKILGKVHLIKRMIQPEEIADGIIFLARNDAMCGEVMTIDGGYSLLKRG